MLTATSCKSEKLGAADLSMGMPDLDSTPSCEAMKCENPDAKCCNGEPCVDVTANTQNCGACGKACRTREQCSSGSCTCTGGGHSGQCGTSESCCADGCHQTMTDGMNCGGCGLHCKAGEACLSGKCSCGPAGKTCTGSQACCSTGCADFQTDAKNCGMCGKTCMAGHACVAGICAGECIACGVGETCCGGACANLLNDPNNCRMCGNKCPSFLGVQYPCILGVCAFTKFDGGMDLMSHD